MFRRTPLLVSFFAAASKINDDSLRHETLVEPPIDRTVSTWDRNWDKRDTRVSAPVERLGAANVSSTGSDGKRTKQKSISRNLLLVRHGQYNINGDKRLTSMGQKQAELCGQRLSDLGIKFTRFVCSEKIRAVETATIISQFIQPDAKFHHDPLLNEGSPVRPVPTPSEMARKPDLCYHEDGPRIEAAFRRYFHRPDADQTTDSFELFVCHANVIRYFVCRALQIPSNAWLRMSLAHCSITWIKITTSGRVSLRSLGDTGFIQPNMISI
uniref:Serine/threonine-protein phosphatase PGAM5, mitochondrial n=1 Tax=Trichuris muris TaxID=70415 RepID=A0A5S6QQY3_TRIMR